MRLFGNVCSLFLALSFQQFCNVSNEKVANPIHVNRDVNEADINKELGYNKSEEVFEHVNNGNTRDVKIGIRLWKKRKGQLFIPYVISSKFSWKAKSKLKQFIRKMNKYLNKCNKGGKNVWINRKKKHSKYVIFKPGPGCVSQVGKSRWNKQYIRLAEGCILWSEGIVFHEMMHTMGFYHEMQRGDRDKYLQVMKNNIAEGTMFNFHKFRTYLTSPYDFRSVMMYPLDAFSKNGKQTMRLKIPLMPGFEIGQRGSLSKIDIAQVNGLYRCGNYPPIIPRKNK